MRRVRFEIKDTFNSSSQTESKLMIVHNDFVAANGRTYRFLRVHQNSGMTGIPGIAAFTIIRDFAVEPLRYQAANDLGSFREKNLRFAFNMSALPQGAEIGLAIHPMSQSTAMERERIAELLNAALKPSKAA
mgnify:CR=1 FL=1